MINPGRKLKAPKTSSYVNDNHEKYDITSKVAMCIAELLAAAPAFHFLHLAVKGSGSYAQHKALNEAYDKLPDVVDAVAEGYQGVTETLLDLPEVGVIKFNDIEECLDFCREKYQTLTMIQEELPFSEVVNNIDLIKDVLNTLKYKLIFLK